MKAQELLEFASRGEPYGIFGIYDGGQGYIFTALSTAKITQKKRTLYFYNAQSRNNHGLRELLELPENGDPVKHFVDHSAFAKGISVVILLAHTQLLVEEDFVLLNTLRTAYPWNFSYAFLGYSNVLNITSAREKAVYLKNWSIMRPLDMQSMQDVLRIYEGFYNKKIPQEHLTKIIELSGGNPGLAKPLVLQSINDGFEGNFTFDDANIQERLTRITETLTDSELHQLVDPTNKLVEKRLVQVGYISEDRQLFTPLLVEFLKRSTIVQQRLQRYSLPPQQRLLFTWFLEHPGELLAKKVLARMLWGDHANNKYSDWALDKLISDLRKNVISSISIKSIKKHGYVSF